MDFLGVFSTGKCTWRVSFSPEGTEVNVGSQHRIRTTSAIVCREESPGSWATTF